MERRKVEKQGLDTSERKQEEIHGVKVMERVSSFGEISTLVLALVSSSISPTVHPAPLVFHWRSPVRDGPANNATNHKEIRLAATCELSRYLRQFLVFSPRESESIFTNSLDKSTVAQRDLSAYRGRNKSSSFLDRYR